MLANDEVFCEKCHVFKPLEMFKNLLHSPMMAGEEEIQNLNARRKQEKQLILDKDLDCKQEKLWFIISSEWLNQWKSFISNKVYSISKESQIQEGEYQFF